MIPGAPGRRSPQHCRRAAPPALESSAVPPAERLCVDRPLGLWRQERAWTRLLVRAFPESAFSWRPAPDAFSCGGLVVHMIQAERFWRRLLVEAVEGRYYDPFGLQGAAVERYAALRAPNVASASRAGQPESFAACLERWDVEQPRTEAALAAFTPEQLADVVVDHPIAGLHLPLYDMLWILTSHEVHHRGQLSAYAKMLGLPQPPIYVGPGS